MSYRRRKNKNRWTSAAAHRLLRLAGTADSVESAICTIAGDLLQDVLCPPTDLAAIMPRLNVTGHEPRDDLVGSGALLRDGDGFKIIYSPQMSNGRKRWTIAHELAHAVFETTGRNPPRRGRELERLCDMIATELLLPRRHFAPRIHGRVCLDQVLRLANVFKTSTSATAIRCAEICGVSVFETHAGKVRWGYGAVRNDYHLTVDSSLSDLVSSAESEEHGCEEIFLAIRFRSDRWIAEWKRIGAEQRTLFMLRPAPPVPART